jgi:chemotaxis response regulator CheB
LGDTAFHPKLAEDGERLKPGHIYIAPPDNHLLLKKGKMLVTKGAAENRHTLVKVKALMAEPRQAKST